MNWRRGLLRAWAFFSVPWVCVCTAYAVMHPAQEIAEHGQGEPDIGIGVIPVLLLHEHQRDRRLGTVPLGCRGAHVPDAVRGFPPQPAYSLTGAVELPALTRVADHHP